ncbi:hypothetical protein [Bowmanella pacifica]|uniref:Lipoprotein n=1 Tax=Bowmanella pacifica TaxID=502051 RepID=A0A917Z3L8_9ALTE|nr:hypothetical protein [Bowmanella pacifica]GGO73012.1 hypothetical protein GCM10010982_32550 [Bowmanella pacifica]
MKNNNTHRMLVSLILLAMLSGCSANNAKHFACDMAEGTVESARDRANDSPDRMNDNDVANGIFTAMLRGLGRLISGSKKPACR